MFKIRQSGVKFETYLPPLLLLQKAQKSTASNKGDGAESLVKLLTAETLVEALNTSAGVNQLLLASVERMALGANFDVDLRLGRTSVDDIAACAGNGAVNIVRMDTLFHSFHLNSGSDLLGPYYKCMCPSQPSISATPLSGLGNDCCNIISHIFKNARHNITFLHFYIQLCLLLFVECSKCQICHIQVNLMDNLKRRMH